MLNFFNTNRRANLESKTYTPKKLTKDQIVSFLQQEPSKTNTEWGNEWGVSRES